MLTFSHLVKLYFHTPEQSAPTVDDIFQVISSVKFKDKNVDMITAYITIINTILLELVIDPSSYKEGMFNFASMVSKGSHKVKGKWQITGIWAFFVKSVFSQIGQLKSMVTPSSFLIFGKNAQADDAKPNADKSDEKKISSLRDIVNMGIFLLAEKSIEWLTVKSKMVPRDFLLNMPV